ncbi:hypothetical protein RHGRI_015741 [Rhododendron griersonianum]|uniref:Reverse transcriptase domain-containing protein n=1 Tax=Rhododendron griersonianum TaxID=479676 RepID=A0AAV6JRB0_9ERIC|nr:hypothetical protein RHGRI_015741 [Rhododendron griersonianum]
MQLPSPELPESLDALNTNFPHLFFRLPQLNPQSVLNSINKILSIHDDNGVRLDDPEDVKQEVVSFYKRLLGTSFPNRIEATDVLNDLDVTKEIKSAMFSIGGDKAPGPDGYNAAFFQKNWGVVGPDVVLAIQSFFVTGGMPKGWNATVLTLVPKVAVPISMKEYRPIACCNVLYKCITKVLAKRMQGILPLIINHGQSAFLKGRSIADNILLMQELVKNYHRDEGPPRCAIKIDLMKAYDSVSWVFLSEMMVAMQFPIQFIQWVMYCVPTAWFSVSLNGNLEGFFKGARGLRQGDPISPYLFLIFMEGFYSILHSKANTPSFIYHPKCKELQIHHLSFADDLFVLCGADQGSLTIVKDALDEFHSFSGLSPNLQKSAIFYSGVSNDLQEVLEAILPIPHGYLPVRYLGVPLITSRLSYSDCMQLKDKIIQRINSWTTKLLSFGVRSELISSVLWSMQVFWCSIFILPKKLLKEIESVLKAFLWTGVQLKQTGAKIKWEWACTPKDEGGLGFKPLTVWNKATMIRHLWALSKKSDSLWVKWVHVYIVKRKCLWQMRLPHDSSWTIRKLFKLREEVQPLIKYVIGNGNTTFLWLDHWHAVGPLYNLFGEDIVCNVGSSLLAKVSSIIQNGDWH